MGNPLKYFIWGYQHHFNFNLNYYLKKLLKEEILSRTFLIGVLWDHSGRNYPMALEPQELEEEIDLFKFEDIRKLSETIFNQDKRSKIGHTNVHHHKRYMEDLEKTCFSKAIKEKLNSQMSGEWESFISFPIKKEEYEVFIVVQLKNGHLKKFNWDSENPSYLKSLIYSFLHESERGLMHPRAGIYRDIELDPDELKRISASNFIDQIMPRSGHFRIGDFFSFANFVSSLTYEKHTNNGSILLIEDFNDKYFSDFIKFKDKISWGSRKRIRKLLEMTDADYYLIGTGEGVIGMGQLQESSSSDYYIASFKGRNHWTLSSKEKELLVVKESAPNFPEENIPYDYFVTKLTRIFGKLPEVNLKKLHSQVISATHQEKGALLVLSKEAKEESERLSSQSSNIVPKDLKNKEILATTSIDGALIIDLEGKCYSIGVILDGKVKGKGDPSRGARYNSALKYVDEHKGKCCAIIISEDGMVDFYPELLPRIKESLIDENLIILEAIVSKEIVDYDEYRPMMNWFEDNKFYLRQEICDKINDLKKEFNKKLVMEPSRIYIQYQDFKQNPELEEDYFDGDR